MPKRGISRRVDLARRLGTQGHAATRDWFQCPLIEGSTHLGPDHFKFGCNVFRFFFQCGEFCLFFWIYLSSICLSICVISLWTYQLFSYHLLIIFVLVYLSSINHLSITYLSSLNVCICIYYLSIQLIMHHLPGYPLIYDLWYFAVWGAKPWPPLTLGKYYKQPFYHVFIYFEKSLKSHVLGTW